MGFNQSKSRDEESAQQHTMVAELARPDERGLEEKARLEERARSEEIARSQVAARLRRQRELEARRQVLWGLHTLNIREEPECDKNIIKVSKNDQILKELLQSIGYGSWSNNEPDEIFREILDDSSVEFQEQSINFKRTNKKCFQLSSIHKVYNPYILLQYKMKEKQYNYRKTNTVTLYHGTKEQNIDEICEQNFNWRLTGTAKGHKFGRGVSFSPFSAYSTNYGDKSFEKVMIAANVLVGDCCLGDGNTIIPNRSSDTTVNEKGSVFVKYDDNTFYPAYVIYYRGFDSRK